jgi:hypothetical protein
MAFVASNGARRTSYFVWSRHPEARWIARRCSPISSRRTVSPAPVEPRGLRRGSAQAPRVLHSELFAVW